MESKGNYPLKKSLKSSLGSLVISSFGGMSGVTLKEKLEPTLLIFVNPKSGGQQGKGLITKMKEVHPEERVIDIIEENGPKKALEKFKKEPLLRILAAGILPLGTGNDIGRVLGWGPGYNQEPIAPIIEEMLLAAECDLDRWKIEIKSNKKTETHYMNNYISLGFADAKIALDFHQKREESPQLFISRGVNKFWYALYGVKSSLSPSPVEKFSEILSITIDGSTVSIPDDLEGIVVLNLPSYAGGMNLWGVQYSTQYVHNSFSDGIIEVIGIRGAVHLVEISTGMGSGVRLGQGRDILITYKNKNPPLPGKIDGEPWLQKDPCTFHISHFARAKMLCKRGSVPSFGNPDLIGWLMKQSGVSSWKSRLFLVKDSTLYWFSSVQDVKPRRAMKLTECTLEEMANKNGFKLISPSKTLVVSTEGTSQPLNLWVNTICSKGAKKVNENK